MSVLILKNIKSEGPGTIRDFLEENKIPFRIVELEREEIPDTKEFDTLVILGGPMSVNDEKIYPYLKNEKAVCRDFIEKDKKVLGICLGAQMMAKALGARVYKGIQPEIGWHDIELTEAGIKNNIMAALAVNSKAGVFEKKFKAFHYHGETFDMPDNAERLAGSVLYQNQAFKYKNNAYAFQFHIEMTKDMIFEWLNDSSAGLKAETEKNYETYRARAINFYQAFFKSGNL